MSDLEDLGQLIQDDLITLCASGWFSDPKEQDKFATLACQIVVDRIKKERGRCFLGRSPSDLR